MPAETVFNRKALRDFHILERYEAGVELKGSEVKSIRAGKANIGDASLESKKAKPFSTAPTSSHMSARATKFPHRSACASSSSTAARSTNSMA